jgi:ribosome-associated translation inhibitor RaiA
MNKSGKTSYSFGGPLRLLIVGSIAVLLVACASAPLPPTAEIQAAELAITSAEQERVTDYAPQELRQAREKLGAARVAVQSEEMALALRLAHESRVSAELASARTASMKAREVNEQMQAGINTLEQEIRRNTGGSQ